MKWITVVSQRNKHLASCFYSRIVGLTVSEIPPYNEYDEADLSSGDAAYRAGGIK